MIAWIMGTLVGGAVLGALDPLQHATLMSLYDSLGKQQEERGHNNIFSSRDTKHWCHLLPGCDPVECPRFALNESCSSVSQDLDVQLDLDCSDDGFVTGLLVSMCDDRICVRSRINTRLTT
jgi:hypothetical protein